MSNVYTKSLLYQQLIEHGGDEIEIKKQFCIKFKEFGITKKPFHIFLKDPYRMEYTEDNIGNYMEICQYFQYTNMQEFYDHIVIDHIFEKKEFLDLLYEYDLIEDTIKEMCKKGLEIMNDDILLYISQYIDIDVLNAEYNPDITDKGIADMILCELNASSYPDNSELDCGITDNGIKHMNCDLFSLNALGNIKITNEGIKNNGALTILDASYNENITDDGLKELDLEELNISFNNQVTGQGIKHMNLEILIANECDKITDDGIIHMDLHVLNASGFDNQISDVSVQEMKNLTKLDASNNYNITDNSIKFLHDLKILNISGNDAVTNISLCYLDLIELDISCNEVVSNNGVKHMQNLKNLNVSEECEFTNYDIKDLDLEILHAYGEGCKITYNGIKHMKFKKIFCKGNKNIPTNKIKYLLI